MNQDRRDILKHLGIIVAATGVVSTEAIALTTDNFANDGGFPDVPLFPQKGSEMQSNIADALEAMVHSIRNRELIAVELDVNSKLGDEFMSHSVTVRVEMPRDAELTRKRWPPVTPPVA